VRCAFVAAVSVGMVKRFENGNSTARAATAVAGTVEFFAGKRAATDCWKVTVPVVSARCSDMVVHSVSVEDNQASSALMALVNLRTVRIGLINNQQICRKESISTNKKVSYLKYYSY